VDHVSSSGGAPRPGATAINNRVQAKRCVPIIQRFMAIFSKTIIQYFEAHRPQWSLLS
jgi:hypothetical protein